MSEESSASTSAALWEADRRVMSDDDIFDVLQPLLFGWHHEGIRRTGEAYPLGAFLLVGATVDVLAGLAYDPDDDRDQRGGRRYAHFVHEYFPPQYTKLGKTMWEGLRSTPLHYFTTSNIVFADSQPKADLHLTRLDADRVILHWQEFLGDYEAARDKYWKRLRCDSQLMSNARARLERRPLMTVANVQRGLTLPMTLSATFPPPTTIIV